MIKRISMWLLNNKSDALKMEKMLRSMEGKVPSLYSIEVGVNTSSHKSAFDIVFIGVFSSADKLAEFEEDSFHKTIGEEVSKLTLKRVVVECEI